jgi:DNA end-binding protein Ku
MMRYADELVDASSLDFPAVRDVKKSELDLATMLIDQLSGEWKPEKYTDEYQQNLMRVINAKVKGTKPRLKDTGPRASGQVVDLMERLRQSLEGAPAARSRRRAKAAGPSSSARGVRKAARSTGRSRKARKPRRAA